jgi:hypothetical protein
MIDFFKGVFSNNFQKNQDLWLKIISCPLIILDFIRNLLLSISTSFFITISIKWDSIYSYEAGVCFYSSAIFLLIAALIYTKIFIALNMAENEYQNTKKRIKMDTFKLTHSLSYYQNQKSIDKEKLKLLSPSQKENLSYKFWITKIRVCIVLIVFSFGLLFLASWANLNAKKTENLKERNNVKNNIDTTNKIIF